MGAGAGVDGGRDWHRRLVGLNGALHPAAALVRAAHDGIEARRGFLLTPFAVMAGLMAYRAVGTEPAPWAIAALLIGAAGLYAAALARQRPAAGSALVLALAVGFALLPLHGALWGTPMLARDAYGTYQARVDEVLSSAEDGMRLVVSEIVEQSRGALPVRRARLFVRGASVPIQGDIVTGRMRFSGVPGPPVPGGFDSQFHAYFDGIGAFGSVIGALAIVSHEETGVAGLAAAIRRLIGARIEAVLSGRQEAVARALVIGDQSRIDDQTRDEMALAGIAHILSISGLHLTLVAGGAFAALRLLLALSHGLAQRVPIKKLAAAGGIAVALAYLAISGSSVAAVRSTVMLILVFGATLFGRRALTMRNVALAALFVLATEPATMFRPSFQLSFSAVVALIGAYEQSRPGEGDASGWGRHIRRFFAGMVLSSTVAGLATLVFTAYHFQQTAPLGLLGNLVALPIIGFWVLPSLAVGVLVMPVGLETPLLVLAGWGIELILWAATQVAEAGRGLEVRPLLAPVSLFFAFGAAAWFAFFTGWLRLAGPILAAVLVLTLGLARQPDVLVADRTQAAGFRSGQELLLLSGRANSFATDVWADTYGLAVIAGDDAVACDGLGCVGTLPGGARVALDTDMGAFIEDCDTLDLVITRLSAPAWCRQATAVIDASDLQRGGVTAAFWNPGAGRFDIVPAIADPGRPWRVGAGR